MQPDHLIHVAYAEDHNLFRTAIVSLLNSTGQITVDIAAENGLQLIQRIETAAMLPDLCLIDLSMPVMDGYTALLKIRRKWPHMKTLILTVYNTEDIIIRMIMAGANGYLLKKCSENEIHDAIISIHEQGYYYSEVAGSKLFHLVKTKSIKLPQFSEMEIEFIKFCCSELSFEQIAVQMNTTTNSVWGCRNRVFEKLNLTSRIAIALFAVRSGLISIEDNTGSGFIDLLKSK